MKKIPENIPPPHPKKKALFLGGDPKNYRVNLKVTLAEYKHTQYVNKYGFFVLFEVVTVRISSERKMSSVVVKDLNENKFFIYSKGAISKIKTLIRSKDKEHIIFNDKIVIIENPELRILACAYKEIKLDDFESANVNTNYSFADILQLNNNCARLEKNLEYLGMIGLRDSLQENISDTVKFLEKNKKYISVCTGDRKETALAVTKECDIVSDTDIIDLEDLLKIKNIKSLVNIQNKTLSLVHPSLCRLFLRCSFYACVNTTYLRMH